MKKPAHQWETRAHRAFRLPDAPAKMAADARAEAFELRFTDGRVGYAELGLDRQTVDAVGASDPDLVHAVRCWLAARGRRQLHLETSEGRVHAGAFSVEELGSLGGGVVGARRIVSLAPSNADIVVALGCFERVIACEDSSELPPGASCERLGPDLGPDLDRVAALGPGLALSSLSVPGMERVVTGLRARGIPQCVLSPRSVDDVCEDIRRVGHALGVVAAATRVVEGILEERQALVASAPSRRTRVYLEWWPKPMFSPAADCFSNELIELAGGVNVFAERTGASVEVTAAELEQADPEVCFVSWCGVHESKLDTSKLLTRTGIGGVTAVRQGRVYPLDERFAGRPGPRMLEASRRMAAAIAAQNRA